MRNKPLHNLLRGRDLTITRLAELVGDGVGRSHLTQVLHGDRDGKQTWPKLARILTHEEYVLAEQYATRVRNARQAKPGLPLTHL